MKNLSKMVIAALLTLSVACAQTQEESATPAPEPMTEEATPSEKGSGDANNDSTDAVSDAETSAATATAAPTKPKLNLPGKCLQPRTAGRCKARFSVFGFDPLKGKCVQYFYGGCEGSENRFDTLEDCNQACNPPATQAAPK